MLPSSANLPELTLPAIQQRLDELARVAHSSGNTCALAFDGDGTLWQGDVSDDVFGTACEANWFLEEARPALQRLSAHVSDSADGRTRQALHQLGCSAPLGEFARTLFDAGLDGHLDERLLFEAMTYCYAGRRAADLTAFAKEALSAKGINERVRLGLLPLLEWARGAGHPCYLVTASPEPIVAIPASLLGFDAEHIIASRATLPNLQVGDAVVGPIPYRAQKVVQLSARIGQRELISAWGDSAFDIDMLACSKFAVAVEPKPALVAELLALPPGRACRWLMNQ